MVKPRVVSTSSQQLQLAVLGPLRASRGAAKLDLGAVRQQAVLAALVLRPDTTVSQRELLDGVWGTEPPGTGGKVIPVYVHRLRRCLRADEGLSGSVIGWDRCGYRFASGGIKVDAARMEEIAAEAGAAERAGDLAAAVSVQSRALELFQGEPLAGLPGPFAAGERFRLVERKIALLQGKLEWQLRLGRYVEAIGELSALSPVHPYSESLAALLMRALYGSGRRADALKVFTRLRRRLVDDLGVEPGGELRRVQHAVLQDDDARLGVAGQQAPADSPRAATARPDRRVRDELPVDVGELVGRDRELALLTAPAEAGVVSVDAVDGVAGAGKTTLVVRAAQVLRERYPDGSLFVDLHGHTEGRAPLAPQCALRRLLRAIGVDDDGTPDDLDELAASWRAATASLRLLLVLDDAFSAEQARPLLPAGVRSKVLVTSRRRLIGLDVKHRISVGGLELKAAEGLLRRIVGESRACRERHAVRELALLCGRLPLALRIAGARLQNRPMWTFGYLVARLADGERRLGELAAGDRGVEAAFRLSYDQLPAAERLAFLALGQCRLVKHDRLAVAAMLDCSPRDAERALEGLVDASLLQQPAAGWYRMHDLVALYARRLVGEELAEVVAMAQARVLRLYVTAARCASDRGVSGNPAGKPEPDSAPFTGWEQAAAWLDTATGELVDVTGNMAAAMGQVDYACWIVEGLVDYLARQGRYQECRAAVDLVLPLAGSATNQRVAAALRTSLGVADGPQSDCEQAHAWFEDALELGRLPGDLREQARALGGLGMVASSVGQFSEAVDYMTEVVELSRRLEDDWLTWMALCNLGVVHHNLGRPEQALDCFARSVALAEKVGSPRLVGKTLCRSGGLHIDLGRHAEAVTLLRRAAELALHAGDIPVRALSLTMLGTAKEGLGDLDAAVELHHRALAVVTEQTHFELEMEVRNRLGGSYLAAGCLAKAREQFELVLALTEMNGHSLERARAVDGLGRCA